MSFWMWMVSSRSHGHAHRWVSHHHRRSHVMWWRVPSWSGVHHVMWHSSRSHWRWSWVATSRIGIVTLAGTHWHTGWLALPSFISHSHGIVGPTLVLNLAAFVNQCLRSSKVQTLDALALATAECTSLETLAVLLETSRLLASASHIVSCGLAVLLKLLLEGIGILGTSLLDGLVPCRSGIVCVTTIDTVASITESFGSKAFAVQL